MRSALHTPGSTAGRAAFGASLCALALLAIAAPASGRILHPYLPSTIPAFNDVNSMTVDSGHLWLAENNRDPRELDASTYAPQLELERSSEITGSPKGIAIGHAGAEAQLYVSYAFGGPLELGVYDPETGALLGRWTGADTPAAGFGDLITGVAADNSQSLSDPAAGDVYVADNEVESQSAIDVFKPKPGGGEEYLTQITGAAPAEPFQPPFNPWEIAVDQANGDLLVVDSYQGHPTVDVFEPTAPGEYALLRRIAGTPNGTFGEPDLALAVDSAEGTLYVAEPQAQVVDEYDISTGALIGRITAAETPGGDFGETVSQLEKNSLQSLAVDPATHRVFVGVSDNAAGAGPFVAVFGPPLILPDVSVAPISAFKTEAGTLDATLSGTVNPLEAGAATCSFAWGTTSALGEPPAPCEANVPEGSVSVPVKAALTGLAPDTTYFYRLTATNHNGTNPGEEEEDRKLEPPHQFTTPGPGVDSESVSDVTSTSATLEATLDPHGAPTSYYFQYGTESCAADPSSCALAPLTPAAIGSGEGDLELTRHLQGLLPHTAYDYRVVAVSEWAPGQTEEFPGPEHLFTTQRSAATLALPDGRAWEQVSPPDKNGALIHALNQERGEIQAAADGGAITYVTDFPTETEVQGHTRREQVLSTRDAAGAWSSCDLATLSSTPEGATSTLPKFPLFSPDLFSAVLQQEGYDSVPLSPEASARTPYLASLSGCRSAPSLTPLVTGREGFADVPPGTRFGGSIENLPGVQFLAASPDLRHVVLSSSVALTSTPTGGATSIYEWSAEAPPAQRLQLIAAGVPTIGTGASTDPYADGRNAISADGTRIFWPGHMYDAVTGETISTVSGTFQLATPQITGPSRLSKAFFTAGRGELFQCEIAEVAGKVTSECTDLTPPSGSEPIGVQNDLLGGSEDGSSVYFIANGLLGDAAAKGATRGDCNGSQTRQGTCNLYLYHEGQTRFIATLSGEDESDWGGPGGALGELTAAVSPNGRYAAFISARSLTGYDNRDARSGNRDEEVYLYDATADGGEGKLVCASCNPTGARPLGVERNTSGLQLAFGRHSPPKGDWIAANLPAWTELTGFGYALYQSRFLSDSGRLFFDSSDALVPSDTNGAEDVYQYEPAGVGGCTESGPTFNPASGGCTDLISSGSSPDESLFMDASETGDDVFFLTSSRLAPTDVDGAYDLYDAHVCSAESPCPPPPSPPQPICAGDACQPPAEAPNDPTPDSLTFHGAGNLHEESAKPKHPKKHHKHKKHKRAASHKRGGAK